MKGFVFTIDFLLSIGIIALALEAFSVPAQGGLMQGYSQMSELGRDYLKLNYAQGFAVTPAQFNSWTSLTVAETQPTASASSAIVRTTAFAYPTACNCIGSCTISSSNSCLSSQESLVNSKKNAWVYK
jgi:hydrogenase/urease accessory protein HupE